jgi:hypothetical protein
MVAVSPTAFHTGAVTRYGSVFGWGRAEGLGLPEASIIVFSGSDDEDDEDGKEDDSICAMLPCRYPQLSCKPPSS